MADPRTLTPAFYESFNTGDVEALAEVVALDYVEVHDGVRHHLGLEGARAHVLGVRRTYGDLKIVMDREIVEGPWVVTSLAMCGIHRGEWAGIAPTGKRVEMFAVNVDKVVDGRIVEHGGAANMLFPLLTAGAVRVVGPGSDEIDLGPCPSQGS